MGRPRGGKVSSSSDGAGEGKIRTSTRERKELVTTYVEDSHSESEKSEREDEPVSDFAESLSETPSEGESSGSEYGVKKKVTKGKVTPKKSPAVARGRGKKGSPKGKAKATSKAAPARGRPGRKPKAAPSSTKKSDRPQRNANKRMKYRERSDSEEEESVEFTSEEEEVMDSESEEEVQQDSGSESGKRGKKRKVPQPKGRPSGRGAASTAKKSSPAKNGSKKVEEEDVSEDEEMDVSKEDEKEDGEADVKEKKAEVKEKKTEAKEKKSDVKEKKTDAKEKKNDAAAEKKENAKNNDKAEPAGVEDGKKAELKEENNGKKAEDVKVESVKSKADEEKMLKNPTETDYKSINFECDKKSPKGEAWNFKIACWNIGGIKSWVKKNGMEYLKREEPDILCLQEVKSSEGTQPPELKSIENYPHAYWSFSEHQGHYGVGLISKVKPENVVNGLPIKDSDSEKDKKLKEMYNTEGRLITAEFEKFFLIDVYVPNGGRSVKEEGMAKPYPERVKNGERLAWDRFLREHIIDLQAKKPVVIAGDLNVAHDEIDLANPKTNTNNAGFTKEEREDFSKLLEEAKLIDTFRALYPDKKDAYSFWSYRFDARKKNVGWRLDYYLISEKLKDSLVESTMRSQVLGSDHCPIVLFLHI